MVSQAAACDGTRITTTADGQQTAPGTFPLIRKQTNEHFYLINLLAKFSANSVVIVILLVC